MSKKEKIKTKRDNTNADELDYEAFNFEDVDAQASSDLKSSKRSPVVNAFKGAISGAKSSALSGATYSTLVRKSLPDEYGEVADRVDEVTSEVGTLYNDAVRTIKPT